jgi:hypothetical protein
VPNAVAIAPQPAHAQLCRPVVAVVAKRIGLNPIKPSAPMPAEVSATARRMLRP